MMAHVRAIERAIVKITGFKAGCVRFHRIVAYETIIISSKREILALILISLGEIVSC
jgi:hypothetical protein